jgi:hypothetical protein
MVILLLGYAYRVDVNSFRRFGGVYSLLTLILKLENQTLRNVGHTAHIHSVQRPKMS